MFRERRKLDRRRIWCILSLGVINNCYLDKTANLNTRWLPRGFHLANLKASHQAQMFSRRSVATRPCLAGANPAVRKLPPLPIVHLPPGMPRYLRIYIAVAALALLAAVHYHLQPFSLARRRTPSTAQSYPLGLSAEDGQLVDSAGLVVDEKGLVSYSPGHAARHPVEILIERGKTLADETESKIASVKSLKDSAMDYVTAFGMKPPQGFEAWCVVANTVFLLSALTSRRQVCLYAKRACTSPAFYPLTYPSCP